MKLKQSVLFLFFLLGLSGSLYAQAWSGIINSTRAENWQRANVGVAGGIPSSTWAQCVTAACNTVVAGPPSSITTAQIMAAVNSAPQNTYVYLPAGTYSGLSSSGILMGGYGNPISNVVLRGAGPKLTILQPTGPGVSCSGGSNADICGMGPVTWYTGSAAVIPPCGGTGSSNCANWTGGFSQGATSVTVTNVGSSNITNGDVIVLDQGADTTDTGGFLVCDNPPLTSPVTTTGFICHQNQEQPTASGRPIGGNTYEQEQWVTVTAGCSTPCKGSGPFTLTISPGLYANNWNATGTGVGIFFVKPTSRIGIENLTIDNTNSTARMNIGFYNCSQCWVKNVVSMNSQRSHVWIDQSPRAEVRDSYFYGTKSGATQSYGMEIGEPSGCDHLIENNIFQGIAGPVVGGGFCGGVIGYNFSLNDAYTPSSYLQGSYTSHDTADDFNLWEGNIFPALVCDDIHGTPGGINTYFRNWLNGRDWNQGSQPTQQTFPIDLEAYSRGFNIIGNVLGTPGYHTSYDQYPPGAVSMATCNTTIYELGWGGGICDNLSAAGVADDTLVRSTLMRWGNYDVVNGSVRWDPTESSPGAVTYIAAQTTPASHTLPASFYLSTEPSWWGTMPYPAIGPDVTGGTGPGGFAYLNPAANCYFNVMGGPANGTGSVLAFDANTCYAQQDPPAPPTSPAAVAH